MGPNGDPNASSHYQNAMVDIHRELRRPGTQRKVFALSQTTPTDLVRSKLSTSEIQSRALSSLPDDVLMNIPDDSSSYSLFQGFQATQDDQEYRKTHRRGRSKSKKLLKEKDGEALPSDLGDLKKERDVLNRRMELMGVRKNMCSSEILDIDNKIANFHKMRQIVLDRLAGLEMEEADLEHEGGFSFDIEPADCVVTEIDNKLEDMEDEAPQTNQETPGETEGEEPASEDPAMDASFMSESIYQKLPSPRSLRQRSHRMLSQSKV